MKFTLRCASAALLFTLLGAAGALAQHACHDDAFRFCGQDVPDHAKIHACLVRHAKHPIAGRSSNLARGTLGLRETSAVPHQHIFVAGPGLWPMQAEPFRLGAFLGVDDAAKR
jgi:hypothetical protein